MNKFLLPYFLLLVTTSIWAQTITTDPVFPKADEDVTFSVDVTGTSLEGYAGEVWIWTWIERGDMDIDAPTNVNPATSAQSDALMTKVSTNPDIYEITFTPVDFFNTTVEELDQIGLKLKSVDWADNIQSDNDVFVTFSSGELELTVTEPTNFPHFVDPSETFTISAASSETADLSISIDEIEVATALGTTEISYMENAPASGSKTVKVTAIAMGTTVDISFEYVVRGSTVQESRPPGIVDGINYDAGDATKVTLSLWAPLKSSVYVIGDFNDWEVSTNYQMRQDGEHFWLEIIGLTPQTEYGFQYIVNETISIADPYADKILDPDDPGIPTASYPNLKVYPPEALNTDWFENRVSILQTAETPYAWQTTNWEKPAKEELLVYELLVRDFLGENNGNYQTLIDTLSYIKDMGFNCVELMPIMEFNGNNSWGYNPTFMLAPDKFYGPKNELKRFIDEAHAMGMVVILDMVLNQNDVPAPYAAMYFDFDTFKPTADNPWFNVNATHPFNVFNDFNHESTYTQTFVDTVNYYWLTEYKFDGFRFDLSKGFTQTLNTDVGLWSAYDASRIAILKRMADKIWNYAPDAYVILEHLADNSEELELSDYGMMLWGNGHFDYKEAILGFGENRSIGWSYFEDRG
ncbi:MAG: alpha-amylase family glycosyl hydrolase, partial [Cyclobacteriaceae bacterium]|nr:alpha-amylase family glycosyl hydrolase [Cyclobacteriaceae bacterium]